MIIVPKNKTIYFGSRKFVEGEILPPHVAIHFQDDAEKLKIDGEKKGPGRPKK